MSRNTFSGSLGGQVQEMQFTSHQYYRALDSENYPHTDGVHDIPIPSCLSRGITSCLKCYNEVYPPCLEDAYGKSKRGSL